MTELTHVVRDITYVNYGYILHVTNTLNKMGKGVAKDLYEKHPNLKTEYHDYLKYCGFKKIKPLGTNLITTVSPDLYIVSLMAQPTIQTRSNKNSDICHLNYKALEECLLEFAQVKRISLPVYIPYKMGCGNAKGDWEIVQEIIKRCSLLDEVIVCVKPPTPTIPKPVLLPRLTNDSLFKSYRFF